MRSPELQRNGELVVFIEAKRKINCPRFLRQRLEYGYPAYEVRQCNVHRSLVRSIEIGS